MTKTNLTLTALLFAATLGYFVDVYDLIIFSVVRSQSLHDLGVASSASLTEGLALLNWQMAGLLLGGVTFGIFADKKGRLPVLFGSILLYSLANLLNAGVTVLWTYKVLRFAAGFGLAGQLGAGVSIVSEVLSAERRGLGTMLIGAVGLLGAVAAGFVGAHVEWRTAYAIGGGMGLGLLILRLGLSESQIFVAAKATSIPKGSLFVLLGSPPRIVRYTKCVLLGAATYVVVGIFITGAPEFAKALNTSGTASAGTAVWLCYLGMSTGDVVCTGLSQAFRSRRVPIILFNVIILTAMSVMIVLPPSTLKGFYSFCAVLGFGCGFWSLVVTFSAEQFGTNLRATVATTVPNFIRAALIPISYCLSLMQPHLGLLHSALVLGVSVPALAILSALKSPETFGQTLDFQET